MTPLDELLADRARFAAALERIAYLSLDPGAAANPDMEAWNLRKAMECVAIAANAISTPISKGAVSGERSTPCPVEEIERVLADAMATYPPDSRMTPDYAVQVALWLSRIKEPPLTGYICRAEVR